MQIQEKNEAENIHSESESTNEDEEDDEDEDEDEESGKGGDVDEVVDSLNESFASEELNIQASEDEYEGDEVKSVKNNNADSPADSKDSSEGMTRTNTGSCLFGGELSKLSCCFFNSHFPLDNFRISTDNLWIVWRIIILLPKIYVDKTKVHGKSSFKTNSSRFFD